MRRVRNQKPKPKIDMKTKTVTTAELIEVLRGIDHATPIGFSALTDTRARKTGNPFAAILKLSKVTPFTGTNYSDAVNRQKSREGDLADFVAQAPQYEGIGGVLVQYKTTKTIAIAVQFNSALKQAGKPVFIARTQDGKLRVISKEYASRWVPVPAKPLNQSLENPILWRTYGVQNIISLRHNGVHYRVRQTA